MVPTTPPGSDSSYDIEFYWDPVCPFCWLTSRWVVNVAEQTGMRVDWRFISLRLINQHKDYATEFPPEYEAGHTRGLKFLRVAAAVRDEFGRDALGPVVTAYGETYWDLPEGDDRARRISTPDHTREVLARAGIPADRIEHLVEQLENDAWDTLIDAEGDMARARTGQDVGTPIITYQPPDGISFFGPVISRVPEGEQAVELWNAVTTLARFPGFAELKRSLREQPHLRVLGADTDRPAVEEDWTGGHRVGHLASDRADR